MAEPLPQADVDQFAQKDPAFAALAAEWGPEAPQRFALAQKRLLTVLALLDGEDARAGDAALRWFEGLPTRAKTAVTRVLGRTRI